MTLILNSPKKKKNEVNNGFHLDKLNVLYTFFPEEKKIIVKKIEFSEKYVKLRNKKWLENFLKNEENNNNINIDVLDIARGGGYI